MAWLPSLCFCCVVNLPRCFTSQQRSPFSTPTGLVSVGISFKPLFRLLWCCLPLHLHICTSTDVSTKVSTDVMGADGSIFPADCNGCYTQVHMCVCACVLWAQPLCYGSVPKLTGYPPVPVWGFTIAASEPGWFSMLCFTCLSILLPLFSSLFPLTLLLFQVAEHEIEGGESHKLRLVNRGLLLRCSFFFFCIPLN